MRNSGENLQALVEKALDGDKAAYRSFLSEAYALLSNDIRRRLSRLRRPIQDADDIAQEALLAIHSKMHTYDREVPVTAWMRAIGRYKLIDFLRARSVEAAVLEFDVEDVDGPDISAVEAGMTIRKLVGALPKRLRESVEMTKIYGFSVEEAAALTGQSMPAVKVNVHRALKTMARMLG